MNKLDNMITAKAIKEHFSYIEFDPISHIYRINGQVKPSVTQILKETGLAESYYGVDKKVLKNAYERGTTIHKMCVEYLEGTLDEILIPDEYRPYIDGWKEYADKYIDKLIVAEQPVSNCRNRGNCDKCLAAHCETNTYCGTPDKVVQLRSKKTALLELKTSSIFPKSIIWQLKMYETGLNRLFRTWVQLGIHLTRKGYHVYLSTDYYGIPYMQKLKKKELDLL
jgi:hypothetical protein